jgi:hypothetical protein
MRNYSILLLLLASACGPRVPYLRPGTDISLPASTKDEVTRGLVRAVTKCKGEPDVQTKDRIKRGDQCIASDTAAKTPGRIP